MSVSYNSETKSLTFGSKKVERNIDQELLLYLRDKGNDILDAEQIIFDFNASDQNNNMLFNALSHLNDTGTLLTFDKAKSIIFGPRLKRIGGKETETFIVADLFPNVEEIRILGSTELGIGVFSSLRKIKLFMPKVTVIDKDCFQETTFVNTRLSLPETLRKILKNAFNASNITEIIFNNDPEYINTFFLGWPENSSIRKITVPNYAAFNTVFLHALVEKTSLSKQFEIKVELGNKDDIALCIEKFKSIDDGYSGRMTSAYNILRIKSDVTHTPIFED